MLFHPAIGLAHEPGVMNPASARGSRPAGGVAVPVLTSRMACPNVLQCKSRTLAISVPNRIDYVPEIHILRILWGYVSNFLGEEPQMEGCVKG